MPPNPSLSVKILEEKHLHMEKFGDLVAAFSISGVFH